MYISANVQRHCCLNGFNILPARFLIATMQRYCFAYGICIIPRRYNTILVSMWRVLAVFILVNKYSKNGQFLCKIMQRRTSHGECKPYTLTHTLIQPAIVCTMLFLNGNKNLPMRVKRRVWPNCLIG